MTSIKGYTDLLRQGVAGPLNQRQLAFLEIIGKNTDRMADLANAVSDIARIDSGRLKIDARVIDVDDILNNVIRALQPEMDEKKQQLVKEPLLGMSNVLADPVRLEQVIFHLLRNANMYTPHGGEIRISITSEEGVVRFAIQDTGIGILPAEQENLFTPFFRSENPVVRDQPGWGLGLYLSSRLLVLMSGELGVWSVPGEGSRFWFTIPAANG
jgi:signal transduction histidine kinase